MNTFSHVPPGFRFHPTDEELVDYYLRKKIASRRIDLDIIRDVDLYKIEPWDLIELCRLGTEDQNEWYFFSHKDKKYPTGTRTNRATSAGFWKATGRDKAIYAKHDLVGMRKTLVFYKGRAPNGQKSDWIMHEYRLETDENGTPQTQGHSGMIMCNVKLIHDQRCCFCNDLEEGWVVCKVFKKRIATTQKMSAHQSICWYEDQISFLPEFDSPNKELDMKYRIHHDHFLQLPILESPMAVYHRDNMNHGSSSITHEEQTQQVYDQEQTVLHNAIFSDNKYWNEQGVDQVMDWRVFDKFVANQLSHIGDDDTKQSNYHNGADASTSTSSYL